MGNSHKQKVSAARTKIIIDTSKCIGDELCVAACPNDVLAFNDKECYPYVVDESKCQACHTCEQICTQGAIRVVECDSK